jgi:hypothetical protein
VADNNAHRVVGSYEGSDVSLDDDFAATWKLDAAQADTLYVIAVSKSGGGACLSG